MEQFQFLLQRFDPGVIWLNARNQIVAMNHVAFEVLECQDGFPLGKEIVKFHPPEVRKKVSKLISKQNCPVDSPKPISMIIAAINKLLLLKISKTIGERGIYGTNVIFYDLTSIATDLENDTITIKKYPVYKNKKIILINISDILYFKADGHYSSIITADDTYLCNLSIGEIEQNSPVGYFSRTHRSYLVNLQSITAVEKRTRTLTLTFDSTHSEPVPVSKKYRKDIMTLLNIP
ncbi:LytR/AlgR family response regulator transcription factor [Grimontia marina]|uniref:Heme-containing CO-sensing transcriptional regulator RcoM 1 n=1 Tax=Grimontia marina TaxID=646534 RepID=A0A128EZU2_9GAMM|nr:LytTR family DNA-binding domain-containing protein [Grimontia marina]CZF80047.1 Heme-containing CO-sensing transcriptional regulator RcoM 1 [Grimontia marina]